MSVYVVNLGNEAEYFSEDYERVHCRHGKFVGYPGGPDYLCGACENGWNTLHEVQVFDVVYADTGRVAFTKYNRAEAYGFVEQIEEVNTSDDEPLFKVLERVEYLWGPSE